MRGRHKKRTPIKPWVTEAGKQVAPERRRGIERMIQLARAKGMKDHQIAKHYRMSFGIVARVWHEPADKFEANWQRAFPRGASYGRAKVISSGFKA